MVREVTITSVHVSVQTKVVHRSLVVTLSANLLKK